MEKQIINKSFKDVSKVPVTGFEAAQFLSGTFADLIDVMDIAMWQLDRNYRVVGFNNKAKQIYGEDALGQFCYQAAAKLDMVCDNCPAQAVYEGKESGRSEHSRTSVSGEEIYIDHIATPIKNEHGEITGTLVLIIDITRYKKQEIELLQHRNHLEDMVENRTKELAESQERLHAFYEQTERSEKLYRSLLNSSADAIAVYNLAGEVQFLSPSFSDLLGWRLEDLQGGNIPCIPDSEKEPTEREIRRLIDTGEPLQNFQTKRLTRDGRLLDMYLSASRYDDSEGSPLGILVILKDVTEKKVMEKQLHQAQKMEGLATLSGGIAHDFNNLLTGVLGNVSLLLHDADLQTGQVEKLKNIESYVVRAANLTKQLLGLSKYGKYEVKPTDLNELIKDCSSLFGETNKDISINHRFEQEIWPAEVDRGQLEQVLLNLFVNARQAMPNGGGLSLETQNITLSSKDTMPYQLDPGRYIKIQVTDTGVGIRDEIKDKIFDPFFTTKQKEIGTGLGLASAYGIITNHAGIIDVSSRLGKGTTFTILLPASDRKIEVESPSRKVLHRGEETILLVDDEEMVSDVGKELLVTLGYKVITADSGDQAIELYRRKGDEIDLVILDMIMPGLSGSETFDQLKLIQPGIKTILTSGYSPDGKAADILGRGCGGFLQKPFNIIDLSNKVRNVLDEPY